MFKKLLDAMKGMHNPILDCEVTTRGFTYRYASLESILRVVKPCLFAYGLFLTQGKEVKQGDGGVYTVLVTKVFEAESGDSITLDERIIPETSNAQDAGSYETYQRRYSLLTAFALVGAVDDDGELTIEPVEAHKAHDAAAEAGKYLGEAITKYSAATGADSNVTRAQIKDKLAMTGEGKSPEALRREADNLLLAIETLKLGE